MQVIETLSEGLKREYKVVLPAADLLARLDRELAELSQKVRINGFRPGKVPTAHLKRVYGKSVMADVVQNAVNEANQKIVADNKLRLSQQPDIRLSEDQAEVERAFAAQGDLAFTVALETLPEFEIGSFDDIAIERPVHAAEAAEIDKALDGMADRNRVYTVKDGPAAQGDKATIDFVGKIGGEPFEGGTGTDIDVIIGSDTFIPGFEAQLVGLKAGDAKLVEASFPEAYAAPQLAGKAATFDVTVKSVAAPGAVTMDDDFAKGFGVDSLDKLREAVRGEIQKGYDAASRDKAKRRLLDKLDARYAFALPQGLVEQEFATIWKQVEAEQKQSGKSFADEGTTEEAARADYRRIAERRVRLGLLLAAVGEQAKVEIKDDEVTQALVARARQFPGQEKMVWDYYQKNPQALAELRAPIFEEKVVDHLLGLVKVTDLPVSREELFKVEDDDKAA
ncbi:MAG: trigger factor [Methylobacteriaceae bacterium]|nr:trigger factor [Methylobacteriaceae bacterium]